MAGEKRSRRPPGQIRDAIIASLKTRPEGATIKEIHAAVEKDLGEVVSPSSVRSYLQLGTRRPTRPGGHFERLAPGRYRLVKTPARASR